MPMFHMDLPIIIKRGKEGVCVHTCARAYVHVHANKKWGIKM